MNSEEPPKEQRLTLPDERSLVSGTSDLVARGLQSLRHTNVRVLRFPGDSVGTVHGCKEYRGWRETQWEQLSEAEGTVRNDVSLYPYVKLETCLLGDVSFLATLDRDCFVALCLDLAPDEDYVDDQLKLVTRLTSLKELAIDLNGCGHWSESAVSAILALPHLEYLELTDVSAGLHMIGEAHQLKGCRLRTGGSTVSDDDLAYLCHQNALESLDIMGTNTITDAGLAHLATLEHLEHLSLFRTRITDAGLAHLVGISLTSLSLIGNKVTDAGLIHLAGLSELKQLILAGSSLTEAGVAALRRMLPNATIYFRKPSERG